MTAVWIGSPHPFDLHEAYVWFRHAWSHDGGQARLAITADSRYSLWLNGVFVARGPARSWPQAQCVDVHDVSALLRKGRNTITVLVYQPGYSHFAYVHRGAAGLLAWLDVDGARVWSTGSEWRARRDPAFSSDVKRVSIYAAGVEDRDLRRADGWHALDVEDDGWSPARIVAGTGAAPWIDLTPRRLPLLEEHTVKLAPIEQRRAPTPSDPDPHRRLAAAWTGGAPTPSRFEIEAGETALWCADLGHSQIGQGVVHVKRALGGERVLIGYAEKRRAGELVFSDPETYCRVRLTDAFTLRPGAQTLATFSLRGGRYIVFAVDGPAHLDIEFEARLSRYPLSIRPEVEAWLHAPEGDAELQAIGRMCATTLEACLADGFVDCPWREGAQWVGDALAQAHGLWALSSDLRPLEQTIAQAVEGAYPDGVLATVLPSEAHAYTVLDYNFTWVELLAAHRAFSGSPAQAVAHWPALKRMLVRFAQDVGRDGLLRSQGGRRLFLDWAPVSRSEPSAIYNLHFLLALQTAVALAQAVDAPVEAAAWRAQAEALATAIRGTFWRNGRWQDDRAGTTASQLAAALAVLTGCANEAEVDGVLDAIVARSLDLRDEAVPGALVLASPFRHQHVLAALRARGRHAEALAIIRARWGRWARAGEPTTWENWDVSFPDGSVCHAFSAHVLFDLVGARQRPVMKEDL
ncbi:MAG: alpha-L-rhamnosidase N-terminal domain-containing protein [Anaerolineales bacterium]|nr:alpha-L-rhamnosidase N-terminal domain-containing protein [Anaerolineales bacterium]